MSAPILTALVDAIQKTAKRKATRTRLGRLEPRLRNYLDEFTNTCPIPDPDSLISDGRGHGVISTLGAQDRAQIIARYGKEVTDSILNNTSLFAQLGGSKDDDHLAEMSRLAGKFPKLLTSTTMSDGHLSETTSIHETDRIPINEIRELTEGKALVMYRELPVTIAYLPAWWERSTKSDFEESTAWVMQQEGFAA